MRVQAIRDSISAVRQQSTQLYLNYFSHHPPRLNPDWEISESERRAVRILWPSKYEWAPASRWMSSLISRFPHLVRVELVDNIPQPYKGTVVFGFEYEGRRSDAAIVYTDYPAIDPECIRNCALCFKLQYQREGYGHSHVIPGGYVVDTPRLYMYLPRLRQERNRRDFQFDLYGRFGRDFGTEIRERAMSVLESQNRFRFEGGLKILPYKDFLQETARAKLCLDLPGRGDFCFRLVNYLAIGSCVIAFPHRNKLHVPLVPGKHIVYTKPDFSDLVERCEYYLEHPAEREEIARNAREYFDLYLHKDNLARYYIRTCIDMLAHKQMPARAAVAR
ncbi:MAG TPA: glycosyltransferase [Bryobacteraceae bacterium]|jgi:hypothetical protein|nr:glycosyltransferase [Bryobacteraceae bacterium]